MSNTMKLSDAISREELREYSKTSDFRAGLETLWHLSLITFAFAIAVIWPNPVTIILGTLILGARILALNVIIHDAGHNGYFKSPALNEFVGHWIASTMCNMPFAAYRDYHALHHKFAGTVDDPDRGLIKDYPISKERLRRKMLRDITGRTGARDLWNEIKGVRFGKNFRWVVFNVALAATLYAVGAVWAYGMWIAARIFIYPFVTRLRHIAEHGVVDDIDNPDPRMNTSTTLTSWWEKLFIAPGNVGYHLEHHFFAAVPPYNLPKVHNLMKSRGYYDGYACISKGYFDVVRRATRDDQDLAIA